MVVEGVRAGSPHLVKRWGACCCGSGKGAGWQPALVVVVVERVRAGSPHLVKSWGGVCFCGSGRGAGWQPALG